MRYMCVNGYNLENRIINIKQKEACVKIIDV